MKIPKLKKIPNPGDENPGDKNPETKKKSRIPGICQKSRGFSENPEKIPIARKWLKPKIFSYMF